MGVTKQLEGYDVNGVVRREDDCVEGDGNRRAMEEWDGMKAKRRGLDRSQGKGLLGSGVKANVIVHQPNIKVEQR